MSDAVVVMPNSLDSAHEVGISELPDKMRCLNEDTAFWQFPCVDKRPAKTETSQTPPPGILIGAPIGTTDDAMEASLDLLCSNIETKHLGAIAVIEFNRPEAKNAISRKLLHEFNAQIERLYLAAEKDEVRALIISSAVDDVFCAGADLKERRNMTLDETRDFLAELRKTFSRLAELPVPSIACVSGFALGGGLELALCCHFRVFSENAVVGLPETRLAIVPGAGGTYRLQKLVGIERSLDMILTGRRVKAVEAALMGLCSRLIKTGGSSPDPTSIRKVAFRAALSLAQEIAEGAPIAIRAALSAVTDGTEEAANAAYELVLPTEDRITALQHFGKDMMPKFAGR